jgi:hypothetical protein
MKNKKKNHSTKKTNQQPLPLADSTPQLDKISQCYFCHNANRLSIMFDGEQTLATRKNHKSRPNTHTNTRYFDQLMHKQFQKFM